MNARYKIVHFVADPFTESRIPVAALVHHGGRVVVVRAAHLPGPQCLGGRQFATAAQIIVEDLAREPSFDTLPVGAGPHAVMGEARSIPASAPNPIRWVESLLAHDTGERGAPEHHRGARLATYGYRFFKNYGVSQHVKKTFQPGSDAGGFLPQAHRLGAVTHFVEGSEDLLLMEPILATRPTFDRDLSDVSQLFAAYKTMLGTDSRKRANLVAYVLSAGSKDKREEALRELRPYAHQVIDTGDELARFAFIHKIRDVGSSASNQLGI